MVYFCLPCVCLLESFSILFRFPFMLWGPVTHFRVRMYFLFRLCLTTQIFPSREISFDCVAFLLLGLPSPSLLSLHSVFYLPSLFCIPPLSFLSLTSSLCITALPFLSSTLTFLLPFRLFLRGFVLFIVLPLLLLFLLLVIIPRSLSTLSPSPPHDPSESPLHSCSNTWLTPVQVKPHLHTDCTNKPSQLTKPTQHN